MIFNNDIWINIFKHLIKYIKYTQFNDIIINYDQITPENIHFDLELIYKNQIKVIDNFQNWIINNNFKSFNNFLNIIEDSKRNFHFIKKNKNIGIQNYVTHLEFKNIKGNTVKCSNKLYFINNGHILYIYNNNKQIDLKTPFRRISFENSICYNIDRNYDIIINHHTNFIKLLLLNNPNNKEWIKIDHTYGDFMSSGLEYSSCILQYNKTINYLIFNTPKYLVIYQFLPSIKLIGEYIFDTEKYIILNINVYNNIIFLVVQFADKSSGIILFKFIDFLQDNSNYLVSSHLVSSHLVSSDVISSHLVSSDVISRYTYIQKNIITTQGDDMNVRSLYESSCLFFKYIPFINNINYINNDTYILFSGGKKYILDEKIIFNLQHKHIKHIQNNNTYYRHNCLITKDLNKNICDLFIKSTYYNLIFKSKSNTQFEYKIPLIYIIEPIIKFDYQLNKYICNKICLVAGLGHGIDKLMDTDINIHGSEHETNNLKFDNKELINIKSCKGCVLIVLEFINNGEQIKLLDNIHYNNEMINKIKYNDINKQIIICSNKRIIIYDVY